MSAFKTHRRKFRWKVLPRKRAAFRDRRRLSYGAGILLGFLCWLPCQVINLNPQAIYFTRRCGMSFDEKKYKIIVHSSTKKKVVGIAALLRFKIICTVLS